MKHPTAKSVTLTLLAAAGLLSLASCTPVPASQATAIDPTRETVVVIHGLGRTPRAMRPLSKQLQAAGYQTISIGYQSREDSPEQILADVAGQLQDCCLGKSPKLHFVGHSLGGLVIRAYLEDRSPDNLGHVVLIGTPNHGSELADHYGDSWWYDFLGPVAKMLGTDRESFPNSIGQPDYPVGVIAGRKKTINDDLLPGDDDGMVSVESTKLEGMSDFALVDVGHSALRRDDDVVNLTITFLKTGRFGIRPDIASN